MCSINHHHTPIRQSSMAIVMKNCIVYIGFNNHTCMCITLSGFSRFEMIKTSRLTDLVVRIYVAYIQTSAHRNHSIWLEHLTGVQKVGISIPRQAVQKFSEFTKAWVENKNYNFNLFDRLTPKYRPLHCTPPVC